MPYERFNSKATITLLGGKEDNYLVANALIETGNKNIVIAGKTNFVGKETMTYSARLTNEAAVNTQSICVDNAFGWAPNDEIAILPTFMDPLEHDSAVITGIASASCGTALTLDRALTYRHFGSD